MYRWLPAALGVFFILGVVAMATTDAFEDSGPRDVSPSPIATPGPCAGDACQPPPEDDLSPVGAPTPILCPAPNCEAPPPPLPENYPSNPQPSPEPIIVNGVAIPIPAGAQLGGVIRDPGGPAYSYRVGEFYLAFTPEGWIAALKLSPGDSEGFTPALDALVGAAQPVTINGRSFRVPWGTIYLPPLFETLPEGYVGPREEAPDLHVIRRGNSLVSFTREGEIVTKRVEAEDAGDLQPVTDALSE